MSSSHVVALVMAAGYSQRFGQHDKRSAMLANGQSLLATSVAHAEHAFALLRVAIRADDTPSLLG
ncbi:MAG: NTP transferase domain-containing protein, partial [Halomonas sp.]|uniref:NTP transferase domain-containing protein n=1 Tax=Halomonas sp. TaxID=1486246 RepID=UPI003F92CD03